MSVLLRGLSQATGLGIPQTAGQSGLASSLREVKHEGPVQMWGGGGDEADGDEKLEGGSFKGRP